MEDEANKKTANLSQIDTTHNELGRRLVEYFVVVSSIERKPGDKIDKNNSNDLSFADWKTESVDLHNMDAINEYASVHFRPTVTARYPLHDHHDNPLHENVTFFCHPSGGIQLRKQPHMPKVHYFISTGGTGRQIYGTCLTLWEPYTIKPRSKKSKDASSMTSTAAAAAPPPPPPETQVYLPKCLVILSTYPYLVAFREYLTQLNRLSKMGEMQLPIERYIANFCSEIPAPPPGSFEVQTTILDSVIRIWSLPHNLPVPWVSLPFSHLFECLDVDNVILVWHCLLLERQVLITSTQLSLLTTASEILLSLLFPMRWSHAYIPVLPHFLIPILSAPMPFFCGIHKANLADALYDLSRDCVLVDLDKNTVTLGPDTPPLPPLPPVQEDNLRAQLDDNVGMVFREARSLRKTDDYSENGIHLSADTKMMAEAMWESKLSLFDEAFHLAFTPEEARKNILNGNDSSGMDMSERVRDLAASLSLVKPDKNNLRTQSVWDAVQEAFLDTQVYLLRNYRKYLVFPSKHNEGSYGGAGFRSKEFIESQRYDMREFLQQLIGTQMFDNFITKRLYGSGESDVAFFDQAVDRFLKSAGMFADVNLGGRLASGLGKSSSQSSGSSTDRISPVTRTRRTSKILGAKKDVEPLLQSARIHRKLKTIVPPEPTSEGLPPRVLEQMMNPQDSTDDADDSSVHSASTTGSNRRNGPTPSSPRKAALIRIQSKAAEIKSKNKNSKFIYDIFPSELDGELFGEPRPLPPAVIAEFDRQRKDAAQFRRKGKNQKQPRDTKLHIQRAHATVDPVAPPSPEVATFTVFFMAFTALVGKELVDMAQNQQDEEKAVLTTYVPTTSMDDDSTTGGDSEAGDSRKSEPMDDEEKEGVAAMKTSRPTMGSMFGDDDESNSERNGSTHDMVENGEAAEDEKPKDIQKHEEAPSKPDPPGSDDGYVTPPEDMSETADTTKSADTEVKGRLIREKLSDLQIEEAKATGRGQLGLAFEMLTMMKRRGIKADPEAYQCLIDACGRVGDTKRATELLGKMHEDGIVADGTVYACLVSAFSADSAWKGSAKDEDLPEWANSTAVEMDWNKLQKRSLLDTLIGQVVDLEDEEDDDTDENSTAYQKLRKRISALRNKEQKQKTDDGKMEFFVTEPVERQIGLGENLLEIVFPDISIDTEDEVCPRCSFVLSDDDVVEGWKPADSNDYTTACPNCTQRFVPHFCVQCSSSTFKGSRGPASPLVCERLSPWVLQKEVRSVMSDREGIENILNPAWREKENKNAVLWWNLVLSCMRYRLPFTFLLQGSFEQQLIAPLPEDDS